MVSIIMAMTPVVVGMTVAVEDYGADQVHQQSYNCHKQRLVVVNAQRTDNSFYGRIDHDHTDNCEHIGAGVGSQNFHLPCSEGEGVIFGIFSCQDACRKRYAQMDGLHVLAIRSEKQSPFTIGVFSNRYLLAAVALTLML